MNASAAVTAAFAASQWYAAYTWPRHEKKIAQQLDMKSVECFLPLYRSVRRWNDRSAEVDLPLFPGYIFVRIAIADRLRVLEVPGVVHLVSSRQQPLALPEPEMEMLQKSIAARRAEPFPFLAAGQRVRIRSGPLQGLEGVVQRWKNRDRIVVSVEWIMRSVALELEACDLELAPAPARRCGGALTAG